MIFEENTEQKIDFSANIENTNSAEIEGLSECLFLLFEKNRLFVRKNFMT